MFSTVSAIGPRVAPTTGSTSKSFSFVAPSTYAESTIFPVASSGASISKTTSEISMPSVLTILLKFVTPVLI